MGIPAAEILVALTALLAGILIARGRALPLPAWGALFAVAGFFHGYAFGESIYGAEASPLWAYLVGLVLSQSVLAVGIALAARHMGAGVSGLAPRPIFDVILSSPPSFPGEPLDLADRAWHAGPDYRDIAALFEQARERLAPGGRFYVLLSSDSDLDYLGALMERARFRARVVEERSIYVESFILYELRAA